MVNILFLNWQTNHLMLLCGNGGDFESREVIFTGDKNTN